MSVNLYNSDWLVEVNGDEYKIIGNKEDGYEIIFEDTEGCLTSYFSSNDFEECLVWCFNS